MAEIAADGAGIGRHGDRLQAHAGVGPKVGHEHDVVGALGALEVEIEAVAVLHQELAPAHDAEAGPDLVPELPLDVVEVARQVAVAPDVVAHDLGDLLLVRGAVEHVALVTVRDAQHLRPIGIVTPALAPQVGALERGHQHGMSAGCLHLLVHDVLDVLQHPEPQRQPGIDAGRGLADHAGAQHQAMGDDRGLGRRVLQRGQEIA